MFILMQVPMERAVLIMQLNKLCASADMAVGAMHHTGCNRTPRDGVSALFFSGGRRETDCKNYERRDDAVECGRG